MSQTAELTDSDSYHMPLESICQHVNLSKQFDILVQSHCYNERRKGNDSFSVTLLIANKKSKGVADTLSLSSIHYMHHPFDSCNDVRSYSTGMNTDIEVRDFHFGDIVVGDLNFDGRDDIAVINASGGNGGALYTFFLQGSDQKFYQDRYLTDSMRYFPEIDKKRKRLTTYVPRNACSAGETQYTYDRTKKQWLTLGNTVHNLCE